MQLLDLTPEELQGRMQALGEPAFRARQVLAWVYVRLARGYDEMTDLPQALRTRLAEELPLQSAEPAIERRAHDGVIKALHVYPDRGSAETVVLPYRFGPSVCLSSQVGCRQGCRFCATGASGFTRSLTTAEIMEQFLWAARASRPKPLRRLVMMGAGEPLDNYEQVLAFLQRLHHPLVCNLSYRHMTISTVGLVPQMRRLAAEGLPFNLALSLHATEDALRSQLIPENRRYPIAEILAAADDYFASTRRRVTFEFILIGDLNDSPEEARRLAQIAAPRGAHVNLIPLNPVAEFPYEPPSPARLAAFVHSLRQHGVNATVRRTLGQDVDAACGQLRRRFDKRGEPVGILRGVRRGPGAPAERGQLHTDAAAARGADGGGGRRRGGARR